MLCYRDRSFCAAYASGECINHQCPRALTDSEIAQAYRWWATFDAVGEPPIAFLDMSKGCPDKRTPEDAARRVGV